MGTKTVPILLIFLVACTGTRTGNPVEEGPTYQSSTRFSPELPGSGGQPTGGDGFFIEPGPEWELERPPPAALLDEATLVGMGGPLLIVMDISDPESPQVSGHVDLGGPILQLAVMGEGAIVAVNERTRIDADSVPEGTLPIAQTKLVHVDLSDPAEPRRAAEAVLDGTFLRFEIRGDRLFALRVPDRGAPTVCGADGSGLLGGPIAPPAGMAVSSHGLGAERLAEVDSVELASDSGRVWVAGDAYFGSVMDSTGASSVTWVDFSTGGLLAGEPLPVAGFPQAVARGGDVLAVLVSGAPDALELFSVDAAGVARRRGQSGVVPRTGGMQLSSDGSLAMLYGETAGLVDLRDPAAPVLASQLDGVARLFEVPAGLLGLGTNADGRLVATLWDATEPTAPRPLARVDAPWALPDTELSRIGFTLSLDHERLVTPLSLDGAPHLGVVRIDAAGFGWFGDQAARQPVYRPLIDEGHAYGVGMLGFEVFPLVEGASESSPVSTLLSPEQLATILASSQPSSGLPAGTRDDPFDRLSVGGAELSVYALEDGTSVVEVEAGGETTEITLPHRGEALIEAGEHVLVIGFDRFEECNFTDGRFEEIPLPDLNCMPEQRRGASLLSLARQPGLVDSVVLEAPPPEGLPADVGSEDGWLGFHPLPDGRVALFVQRIDRCSSQETCDALGVPAYESFGTPGCNPQVQDCESLPSIITFVSGHRATLLVLLLDGSDGDALSLSRQGVIDGLIDLWSEPTHEVGWQLLLDGDDFALVHEDPIYGPDGNSIPNPQGDATVRFFLHRIEVHAEGLEVLAPVNTPGRPVSWQGASVLSLDPGYDDAGEPVVALRRSSLREGAAFIEDTLELGGGFLDARRIGASLWILRGEGDPCSDGHGELSSVPLDADPLAMGSALELPGWRWSFDRLRDPDTGGDDVVIVRGGPLPSGVLTVDASDPASPRVERYVAGVAP